ncbi:MAG: flagellin [Verrucomicrobiota bacterium]|nr:flagellin [Verrucomicrobiota bacterium]
MVINTNTSAQAAANNLQASSTALGKSLARLSSGSKIVSPADDAAGLAVASRLDAQIQRLSAANSNVGNAISFTQTQDGFLKKIGKALDRMSELAILAQDTTKTDADRGLYDTEFQQLSAYISNASTRDFNGVPLFSATPLPVTADAEGNTFTMDGIDLGVAAYTDATGSSIGTLTDATTALTNVKLAIDQLSQDRATIGAYQSRLNFTVEQLTITRENLTAASSRIKDVDVAEESTQFARQNILVQSGTAMLAQANQMPQSVLRLLQ